MIRNSALAPQTTLVVGILAPHGAQALDIVGPMDAFIQANGQEADGHPAGQPRYRVEIIGRTRAPIIAASGLRLLPDRTIDDPNPHFDTLLVAGSPDVSPQNRDNDVIRWLSAQGRSVRRLGAVCNGCFVVAASGLLTGRRATTHWRTASRLAEEFPDIRVEPDRLFIRDGMFYTSAGVTAGIDLSLSLIEQDYGHEVSLAVARELVVFLRRPGGQSQFSTHLQAQSVGNSRIQPVLRWIIEHLGEDLSVDDLAAQAAMSRRSFTRACRSELNMSVSRFLEKVRVERARIMLETSPENLQRVAHRCGFGSLDVMRRAFLRQVGVTPMAYRARFANTVDGGGKDDGDLPFSEL
ncbi:GlxA family transcriptional regulator [Acetobacteraceae bacterium KSS8]|uniref:GlxA family transcriptional regulator n=1 Tax=Endosaccharibacter trunci TaxID=2812733 RepID=A0ABT1W7Q0_9PROT|nr:GlxA family transcriptional regulator [Acetobacteraceae bacterium KSS8]